jgi:hypothetical protein
MTMAFVYENKLKFLWNEKVNSGEHSQNKAIVEFGLTFQECPPLVGFAHRKT